MSEPVNRAVYVSITGLVLKKPWHVFVFYFHAIRAMRQARRACGNLCAENRTINGVHHTLSVWETKTAMHDFLYSGAHKRAIDATPSFATGKTLGFVTDTVPGWDEVQDLWRKRGRGYGAATQESDGVP